MGSTLQYNEKMCFLVASNHLITRAKHAVIMGILSFLLRQGTTLFSDGTGLVSRAGPPPERRSVNTALLKTRNRLIL